MTGKNIIVKYLARVEGEGGLNIQIKDDAVTRVQLKIFEPPRFFEAFLKGRNFTEAPDITCRICGICPVAYQMTAVHAMEAALGVTIPGPIRALRRLLYCGEWIESHGLHVFMLHAPDFLGYQDAIQMAQDHPDTVKMGLRLKKVGNDIVTVLGGREIHPINVRVGGFYKAPSRGTWRPWPKASSGPGRRRSKRCAGWAVSPSRSSSGTMSSWPSATGSEYPFNEGRVVSNKGLDIAVQDYEQHFVEEQVPHSHALHSSLKERGAYFAGPLARYNLNFDRLTPLAQEMAREAGLGPVCLNPFQSIIVRAVELLYAVEEALAIIAAYEKPDRPAVPVEPRAVTACAATEAPRGLLYHRYRLDADGVILEAKIVPPTSQNQGTIEADLHQFVSQRLDLPDEQLTWQCEQMVRNYDPCISCATHFLKVNLERG